MGTGAGVHPGAGFGETLGSVARGSVIMAFVLVLGVLAPGVGGG